VSAPAASRSTSALPWEARLEDLVRSFTRTWLLLIRSPNAFYERMARHGGMGEPFAFMAACVKIATAAVLVQLLVVGIAAPGSPLVAWFPGSGRPSSFGFNMTAALLLLPPLCALGCGLDCLVLGAAARLLGGAGSRGAGVEAYFSVFAYACGALLIAVVPGAVVVALPWFVVLGYVGLRRAVGLPRGTAVGVLVGALVVWGVVCGLLYLLVV